MTPRAVSGIQTGSTHGIGHSTRRQRHGIRIQQRGSKFARDPCNLPHIGSGSDRLPEPCGSIAQRLLSRTGRKSRDQRRRRCGKLTLLAYSVGLETMPLATAPS